ncbi:GNAT family protein [Vibrio sp. SCSIO 43136]|uniref:GNAT family N-acetyltransferase n=1 Tax=Vibrio sp. SCSIO 43136 TaxID=2819101 RepID=UPI0020755048|nr:GNAT family protein [Vibrio sp. SCSIO 43136]USD66859.1 GNAT family N-acetyltransferase [Vibrio sp. SCSIO 43136]
MFKWQVDNEVALELVNSQRAHEVFQIIRDENEYLSEWMAWPPHTKKIEDYQRFVCDSLHKYAEGKGLVCFILYKSAPVGCISFNYIDYDLKKVEIGYWLSKAFQGKGIMTRACKQLIGIAFTELNMDKVEIPVSVGNMPSRGVCERLGFEKEGIITNSENLNGRIMDHVYYSLSRNTWNQT